MDVTAGETSMRAFEKKQDGDEGTGHGSTGGKALTWE